MQHNTKLMLPVFLALFLFCDPALADAPKDAADAAEADCASPNRAFFRPAAR